MFDFVSFGVDFFVSAPAIGTLYFPFSGYGFGNGAAAGLTA